MQYAIVVDAHAHEICLHAKTPTLCCGHWLWCGALLTWRYPLIVVSAVT